MWGRCADCDILSFQKLIFLRSKLISNVGFAGENFNMQFWTKNIDAVWSLSNAYRKGGLTLFLGAGVSQGCGLPMWSKLVEDLHTETCRRMFRDGNGCYGTFDHPKGWGGLQVARSGIESKTLSRFALPIQSRFCKSKLGKDYTKVLQETLYKKPYVASKVVRSILKLENLKAICTYNYDDLIESNSGNNNFYSTYTGYVPDNEGVPVNHVHGLLPNDLSQDPKGDIVFSEDEYHALYMNSGHWSNLVQLRLLLESESILFIGLSFEDPNLRKLIDAAKSVKKKIYYYNICKLPFARPLESMAPIIPEEVEISVLDEVYDNLGVTNLWIDDYDPDISIIIESLSASDPVEKFTTDFRNHLEQKLIKAGASTNSCDFSGCPLNTPNGSKSCVAHTMGDRTLFTHYAPTPKTLNDECSEPNCKRITSGLSNTCIQH